MPNYYFVVNALPDIALGVAPELSFKEVREMLALNLSAEDLRKVKELLRPIDLYNIRALWLGMPLDDKGNYPGKELEEVLLVKEGLPAYLDEFLERYETVAERLRNFSCLSVSLFQEAGQRFEGFLKRYFQLQRELRLVLTAIRAKQTGRDLVRELQFEDASDPFVAEIIAQRDTPDYTPPLEYTELKTIFIEHQTNPQKLNYELLQFEYKKIEELEENQHFTMDRILGYLARLILVESWQMLDRNRGVMTVEQLSHYG